MAEPLDLAVLTAASRDIQKLSAWFAGLAALGPELAKIASIEGAVRESQQRLAAVRAEEENLALSRERSRAEAEAMMTARLAEIAAEVARRRAEADREIAAKHTAADTQISTRHQEMETEYERVITEAETEAKRHLDDAMQRAREIVSDAHTSVAEQTRLAAHHAQEVDEHRETLVSLQQEVRELKAARDTAREQAQAAQDQHQAAVDKFAAFRASLPG